MPALTVRRFALPLVALVALGASLVGCGPDAPRAPAEPDEVEEHGSPSAFRLRSAPQRVRHDVPLEQVLAGIPVPEPRDKIPALLAPRFLPVSEARHLQDAERVIVLTQGTDAAAYPLRILDLHELVNDVVGGVPLLVTWCPLCRSALAFERRVAGVVRTFGVSGYLYRSAVLAYDHQSESFWSQIAGRAVVGPLTGTPLTPVALRVTSWAAFRDAFPEGRVLGPEQAGRSPEAYLQDPNAAYHRAPGLMFKVDAYDRRLRLKDEVLGVQVGRESQAWSLAWLRAQPRGEVAALVGGRALRIRYDAEADQVVVLGPDGREEVSLRCYWFAWFAFHPETGLTGGA